MLEYSSHSRHLLYWLALSLPYSLEQVTLQVSPTRMDLTAISQPLMTFPMDG